MSNPKHQLNTLIISSFRNYILGVKEELNITTIDELVAVLDEEVNKAVEKEKES